MKKTFSMSMYMNAEALYKAKCEYLQEELERLEIVVKQAKVVCENYGVGDETQRNRDLYLSLVAAEVIDPQ